MDSKALEILEKKIKVDIDTRVATLKVGNFTDLAEYKNVCGQIRGLEYALGHINSLLQTMKDSDE